MGKRLIIIITTNKKLILLAFLEQLLFVKNTVVNERERKGTEAGTSVKLHNKNNHKKGRRKREKPCWLKRQEGVQYVGIGLSEAFGTTTRMKDNLG